MLGCQALDSGALGVGFCFKDFCTDEGLAGSISRTSIISRMTCTHMSVGVALGAGQGACTDDGRSLRPVPGRQALDLGALGVEFCFRNYFADGGLAGSISRTSIISRITPPHESVDNPELAYHLDSSACSSCASSILTALQLKMLWVGADDDARMDVGEPLRTVLGCPAASCPWEQEL